MKPYIVTFSDRVFDLAQPQPSDVHIVDIAEALGKICRFTGHSFRFYSVAEHSVLTSHIVRPELALHALMHDAAEAYIGDVSAPLKSILPDYRRVEERVEAAVQEAFGLGFVHPAEVKRADLAMLAMEREFVLQTNDVWAGLPDPAPVRPGFWDPTMATQAFLVRFDELTAGPAKDVRLRAAHRPAK